MSASEAMSDEKLIAEAQKVARNDAWWDEQWGVDAQYIIRELASRLKAVLKRERLGRIATRSKP